MPAAAAALCLCRGGLAGGAACDAGKAPRCHPGRGARPARRARHARQRAGAVAALAQPAAGGDVARSRLARCRRARDGRARGRSGRVAVRQEHADAGLSHIGRASARCGRKKGPGWGLLATAAVRQVCITSTCTRPCRRFPSWSSPPSCHHRGCLQM